MVVGSPVDLRWSDFGGHQENDAGDGIRTQGFRAPLCQLETTRCELPRGARLDTSIRVNISTRMVPNRPCTRRSSLTRLQFWKQLLFKWSQRRNKPSASTCDRRSSWRNGSMSTSSGSRPCDREWMPDAWRPLIRWASLTAWRRSCEGSCHITEPSGRSYVGPRYQPGAGGRNEVERRRGGALGDHAFLADADHQTRIRPSKEDG